MSALLLAAWGWSASAGAAPAMYMLSDGSGYLSGTLNGVPFSGAYLELYFWGDTANIAPFTFQDPSTGATTTGYYLQNGTSEVYLTYGCATQCQQAQAQFLPTAGIYVGIDNTNGGIGIGALPMGVAFPGYVAYPAAVGNFSSPSTPIATYDLSTAFSGAGYAFTNDAYPTGQQTTAITLPTTAGPLTLNATNLASGGFTATTGCDTTPHNDITSDTVVATPPGCTRLFVTAGGGGGGGGSNYGGGGGAVTDSIISNIASGTTWYIYIGHGGGHSNGSTGGAAGISTSAAFDGGIGYGTGGGGGAATCMTSTQGTCTGFPYGALAPGGAGGDANSGGGGGCSAQDASDGTTTGANGVAGAGPFGGGGGGSTGGTTDNGGNGDGVNTCFAGATNPSSGTVVGTNELGYNGLSGTGGAGGASVSTGAPSNGTQGFVSYRFAP